MSIFIANVITMADQHSKAQEDEAAPKVAGESVYCTGMFLEKKEDKKPQEDVAVTDAEPMEEEEKPNLLEKLRQSESKSGSVSHNFWFIKAARR